MIRIGPGGSDGLGYELGILKCKELGLKVMEIEFTHGVNMKNETAKLLGELAYKNDVVLTIHAPYYINLASEDLEKVEASKKRILDSVERGHHMKARYVVFHPGFYQSQDKNVVYEKIKVAIQEILKIINGNGWNDVTLTPETTGKATQFGDIDELLRLKNELEIGICVDFSHIYARNLGNIDYPLLFARLPKKFHAHFSGIEYTLKGEKNHILTTPEFFEPLKRELSRMINDDDYEITVINESPDPINDAKMMNDSLMK